MFKRYAIYSDPDQLAALFQVNLNEMKVKDPNYNAGVGGVLPILVSGVNRERVLVSATWNPAAFNVSDDSTSLTSALIQRSPDLSKIFQRKRCLIFMNGYFDWKKISDSVQIPFYFRILNSDVFGVAGLYDKDGSGGYMFMPIETRANEIVEPLSESMPAILSKESIDVWLDPLYPSPDKLHDTLMPHNTIDMASYRVKLKDSDTSSNSKDLIQPVV
jgi:putative SOS response-associated peptidase YedK